MIFGPSDFSKSRSSSWPDRKFPTLFNLMSTTTFLIVVLLISPSSRSNNPSNGAWFPTTIGGSCSSSSILEVEACPFLLKQMIISNAADNDGDGDGDDRDRRLSEMEEWIQQERLKHRKERQA